MHRTVLTAAIVALMVGGGSATAARLITGKDIRNGTITGRDIHKNSVSMNRLSSGTQRLLRSTNAFTEKSSSPGAKGDKGDPGDTGAKGDTGAQGAAGQSGSSGSNGSNGAAGADADQPRVIDGGNLRGFTLAPRGDNGDTSDNGTLTFDTPPSPPTLGDQSLKFTSSNGKPVVVYAPLPDGYAPGGPRPLLAELTKASYGSLIHTQPQKALDVSLQIEVVGSSSTKFASGYTTVVYEPYQNDSSETLDEWHRHSVDRGKVWSTSHTTQSSPPSSCVQSNPCTFRDFVEQNPNAEVATVKLRIGQNSGDTWSGFEGYVDDFSYGFGPVTRFDFGA